MASFWGGEAASSLPSPLGKGDRAAVDRVLSQTAYLRRFLFHLYHLLETIFFALFHTARTLSGSLRSPPSPRGEGFVSKIPLSPSNLRPFGAPPSIGRRECPREPLPLEGAAERSEAGLASFWGGARVLSYNGALETISPLFHTARTLSGSLRSPPSPRGEGFVRRYSFSTYACIRSDDAGIAASSYRCLPHWGRGTASAVDRVLSQTAYLRRFLFHLYHLLEKIFFALFYTARTLSGSLRSPPSPHGEGFVRRYSFSPHMRVFALTMQEKRYPRIAAFPIGEGGPRQRWIGCSR